MIKPGRILRNATRHRRPCRVLFALASATLLLNACTEAKPPDPTEETPGARIRYLEHFDANGAFTERTKASFRLAGVAALRWQAEAPADMLDWLQEETESVNSSRYHILLHALAGSACESPETILQVYQSLASALVSNSAQTDGLIASRYLSDVTDEATRIAMAPKIAKTLADRDPEAGLVWLVETAEKENIHKAFEQFYAHLARYDVGYAVELFPSDQAPMIQQEAADAIMLSAHQVELDQVYDWLESIHPDASKGHSMSRDLKNYASIDPQRVEQFLANHPESRRLSRPHERLGYAWSVLDPAAAMAWVRELPKGRGRSGAAYSVTEGLLDVDDQKALDWIESLPPGMKRDWAVDALFDSNAELRPELVFEQALHVTGKHRRERYMRKTIELMKAQGKLNAAEILARHDIPGEDWGWLTDLLQ